MGFSIRLQHLWLASLLAGLLAGEGGAVAAITGSVDFCNWHSNDFVRAPLPRITSYSMKKDKDLDWPSIEPIQLPTTTSAEILAAQQAPIRNLSFTHAMGKPSVFYVNQPAEFSVRMDGQFFENAYSDDLVIQATFTNTSNSSSPTITRRAFYYQDYEVVSCGNRNVFVFRDEAGTPRPLNEVDARGVYRSVNGYGGWRVRMTPLEPGNYRVDVRVLKRNHANPYEFQNVYSMNVGAARPQAVAFTKPKGGFFVKVSPSENLKDEGARLQDKTILFTGSMALGEREELERRYPGAQARDFGIGASGLNFMRVWPRGIPKLFNGVINMYLDWGRLETDKNGKSRLHHVEAPATSMIRVLTVDANYSEAEAVKAASPEEYKTADCCDVQNTPEKVHQYARYGSGKIDQVRLHELDELFAWASANGVYLNFTLSTFHEFLRGAPHNADYVSRDVFTGGTLKRGRTPGESNLSLAWRDPATAQRFKWFVEYIEARYGSHPALAQFEVRNEINGSMGFDSMTNEVKAWYSGLIQFLSQANAPYARPISTSFSVDDDSELHKAINAGNRYLDVHQYFPIFPLNGFDHIERHLQAKLHLKSSLNGNIPRGGSPFATHTFKKPVFFGEFGDEGAYEHFGFLAKTSYDLVHVMYTLIFGGAAGANTWYGSAPHRAAQALGNQKVVGFRPLAALQKILAPHDFQRDGFERYSSAIKDVPSEHRFKVHQDGKPVGSPWFDDYQDFDVRSDAAPNSIRKVNVYGFRTGGTTSYFWASNLLWPYRFYFGEGGEDPSTELIQKGCFLEGRSEDNCKTAATQVSELVLKELRSLRHASVRFGPYPDASFAITPLVLEVERARRIAEGLNTLESWAEFGLTLTRIPDYRTPLLRGRKTPNLGIEFMPERAGMNCFKASQIDPWSGNLIRELPVTPVPALSWDKTRRGVRVTIPELVGDAVIKVQTTRCYWASPAR